MVRACARNRGSSEVKAALTRCARFASRSCANYIKQATRSCADLVRSSTTASAAPLSIGTIYFAASSRAIVRTALGPLVAKLGRGRRACAARPSVAISRRPSSQSGGGAAGRRSGRRRIRPPRARCPPTRWTPPCPPTSTGSVAAAPSACSRPASKRQNALLDEASALHRSRRWRRAPICARRPTCCFSGLPGVGNSHLAAALDRTEANPFFRLVSTRYEGGSMLLTSNKHVRDWLEIFAGDEILTTAILDRLRHHVAVVHIDGQSYPPCQYGVRRDPSPN